MPSTRPRLHTTTVNNASAPPSGQWPFKAWLANAAGSQVATTFGVLALPSSASAPAMIEASSKYLDACNASGACLSPSPTNLNYYFDKEASSLFSQAFSPGGSWRALAVVGDGYGPIPPLRRSHLSEN